MSSPDLTRALCRIKMKRGQVTLLKELYEREGEFVSSSELADRIRWSDNESLWRVIGAFGRRISATGEVSDEKPSGAFLNRKRDEDGEMHYQLRPEARDAIESTTLTEIFKRPMDELMEGIHTEIERTDS
jgi:hypothetical protein